MEIVYGAIFGGGVFLVADARTGEGVLNVGDVTLPNAGPESLNLGGGKKKRNSHKFCPTSTMAAGDRKKRARAQPATLEPRKRSKASDNDHIPIDKLAWQEVVMPDRLDDVEGFMGMEEVDGVDVFKTDDGGLVYKVCCAVRALTNSMY